MKQSANLFVRILVLVLTFIWLVFGMVSCGDDDASPASSSSSVVSSINSSSSSADSNGSAGSSSIASSESVSSSSEALSSSVASSSSALSGSAGSSSIASSESFSSSSTESSSSGPIVVSFSGLTANGSSGTETTTELTLTFDVEPVGLALGDITITGATRVSLSGAGTTRTLTISDITIGNGGEVLVALASPSGYVITPVSKTVEVYYCNSELLASIPWRDLATVSGGTFVQQTDDATMFTHTLADFRIAKYEVTYELWYTVYTWATNNGYYFKSAGVEGRNGTTGAAPSSAQWEPVCMINWRDAIVWCNAYGQMQGLTPVYCTDSELTIPVRDSRDGDYSSSICPTAGSFDNPCINWNATGYRLPTEGEWHYAASYIDGSNWTPYDYASGATAAVTDMTATDLVAWYKENAVATGTTKAVGTKKANFLGIHDMSGNMSEWCHDWYGTFPTTGQTDYRGLASGDRRSTRGGCYASAGDKIQIGYRSSVWPYYKSYVVGFRVACRQ